jgi:hypothetical protein
MDINNICSIYKIIKDTLRKTSKKYWNFNQFVVIVIWKFNKDNKSFSIL